MKIKPAQYLLRFDDLCPTMSRERWNRFAAIITNHGVRPILAVVPDNHDPDLAIDDPDPRFWDHMRQLEAKGATIAMHGYRHLCQSAGKSILGLHRKTEFAGVAEQTQREWIKQGMAILRSHGLTPRLFVAPRHGFDRNTLSALAAEGLGVLSDGFATRSFSCGKVVWIPQQLWEPADKSQGLWTICIHSNTASPELQEKLDSFLAGAGKQFVSFEEIVRSYEHRGLSWIEQLSASFAVQRVRFRGIHARAARGR